MDDNEMYCICCHGRGLDQRDKTCRRCKGTGYEPDTFEMGRGPAGCQALQFLPSVEASHRYGRSENPGAGQIEAATGHTRAQARAKTHNTIS